MNDTLTDVLLFVLSGAAAAFLILWLRTRVDLADQRDRARKNWTLAEDARNELFGLKELVSRIESRKVELENGLAAEQRRSERFWNVAKEAQDTGRRINFKGATATLWETLTKPDGPYTGPPDMTILHRDTFSFGGNFGDFGHINIAHSHRIADVLLHTPTMPKITGVAAYPTSKIDAKAVLIWALANGVQTSDGELEWHPKQVAKAAADWDLVRRVEAGKVTIGIVNRHVEPNSEVKI